jgi:hypothetical protein
MNIHCIYPLSINEEGGVRSSLASEARLSFIIHPTRFWLTIAFYSNYSLVFLVTVARPDERENYYFQTDPEPRLEQFWIFLLVPSLLFIPSESLPFGSLALGKIEAAEMLASKRLKGSDQGNEHFSLIRKEFKS